MTEPKLKVRVGLFLILAHFGILLLVIALWLAGGFLTEEMTTSVAIIAPFFAAYTTAIIRHLVETRHQTSDGGKPVTTAFFFISLLTPGLFVLLVAGAVVLKAFNVGLTSFEDFKVLLATAETGFGVYVGQLIYSLFERPEEAAES